MTANAIRKLEDELGRAAGVAVELERPADPAHGDYATTVALRLAKERKQPPRAIAEELAAAAEALPSVDGAEVAGPGFVNLRLRTDLVRRGARRDPRRRGALRGRFGGRTGARPGRDGLSEPDGPDHRRGSAERRLRRLGRAGARLRRPPGRARVLLQRLRRADGPVPRLRRRDPTRRGAARGRLPGRVRRRARTGGRRPGAADARADRGLAGALPDPLRRPGRGRASWSSGSASTCRGWTRSSGTVPCGPARRHTATTTTACSSARAAAGRRTAPPTSSTSRTSSAAASTAPCTCSAPTTTGRATGTRPSRACSATTRSGSRCCCISSSI
jgi:hypothetical protein